MKNVLACFTYVHLISWYCCISCLLPPHNMNISQPFIEIDIYGPILMSRE